MTIMRAVTVKTFCNSQLFFDGPGLLLTGEALKFGGPEVKLLEQLCDLGDARIAEMDAAQIDMQILSLTSPGTEQLGVAEAESFAKETNDYLAAAMHSHPARFCGFASLPTADRMPLPPN